MLPVEMQPMAERKETLQVDSKQGLKDTAEAERRLKEVKRELGGGVGRSPYQSQSAS